MVGMRIQQGEDTQEDILKSMISCSGGEITKRPLEPATTV